MKKFWNILLSSVMLIGLSVAVSAQQGNDPKKPPPKGDPPKVEPREKPPPRQNPEKPKKPDSGSALLGRTEGKYLA